MLKLSSREKFLLLGIAFVLGVFLVNTYMLQPFDNRVQELIVERQNLEMQLSQTVRMKVELKELQDSIDTKVDAYKRLRDHSFYDLSDEDVLRIYEVLVSSATDLPLREGHERIENAKLYGPVMGEKCNWTFKNLTISAPYRSDIKTIYGRASYDSSERIRELLATLVAGHSPTTEEQTNETPVAALEKTEEAKLMTKGVVMTAVSDYQTMLQFLKRIDSYDRNLIIRDLSVRGDAGGSVDVTLSLDLYYNDQSWVANLPSHYQDRILDAMPKNKEHWQAIYYNVSDLAPRWDTQGNLIDDDAPKESPFGNL